MNENERIALAAMKTACPDVQLAEHQWRALAQAALSRFHVMPSRLSPLRMEDFPFCEPWGPYPARR